MHCFITSYTRKTSNEVCKRKKQIFESLRFVEFVKEAVAFRQRLKKRITEVKTSHEVFETLCFVQFVKRSI